MTALRMHIREFSVTPMAEGKFYSSEGLSIIRCISYLPHFSNICHNTKQTAYTE